MHINNVLRGLLFIGQAVAGDATDNFKPTEEVARERGHHIFNAIHHAGRLWGSSLHHNGMSFFRATVPEHTLLYHGNRRPDDPEGIDWLSFEIEHAEVFSSSKRKNGTQEHGHLHVYKTMRPLQLLYVDGTSGGTTDMGTLDSQDYILRSSASLKSQAQSSKQKPVLSWDQAVDETNLATDLCQMATEWNLDGIVRMEAGFEIIKCNFSDGLETVHALRRPYGGKYSPLITGSMIKSFEFLRGMTGQYDGLGSSQLSIDYSSMVSAFFFPINLTNPDFKRPDLPRLVNASSIHLSAINGYLGDTLKERTGELSVADWRGVSDLIVKRYADRIQFMAEDITSARQLKSIVNFLLTVFIDYTDDAPDIQDATYHCTALYPRSVPLVTEADFLIYNAFRTVTMDICTSLFDVRQLIEHDLSDEEHIKRAQGILKPLMNRLNWTRFKRCPPCPLDQVCAVPVWPLGTIDQYEKPKCSSGVRHDGPNAISYWGLNQGKPVPKGDKTPASEALSGQPPPNARDGAFEHIREL